MKKKYWIPALILFAAGIFVYLFVYAYQFTGIMLCALGAVRLVFGVLNLCRRKVFFMAFCIALAVAAVAMIATGIGILTHMSGADEPESDYVIVLGAAVRGTEPSASLLERLQAAKAYAEEYPEAILVLSGAQGEKEEISEAQCMYHWLVENGVAPNRLRLEERATTTEENIRHSAELIAEETGAEVTTVGIISSEYHLFRAEMIAEELGITARCYAAETRNKLFFCNMLGREIFAVWKMKLNIF